ncbi:hypothetical protein EB796_018577 [Bugula neritina]|uniref:Uncharacterized protein n=1 Tax=Bugula neritina TaxID=10212 RepID=A0A7J7JAQ1_BUGNE|nr:hypothetical protein EB796_018577 [Bugula neritina]
MKFEVNLGRKVENIICDSDNHQYKSSSPAKLGDPLSGIQTGRAGKQHMAGIDMLPPIYHTGASYLPKRATKTKLVCEWTPEEVVEWLSSKQLYGLLDHFRKRSVNGAELIQMTDKLLQEQLGVEDSCQRKALILCVDELCGRQVTEEDSEGSSTESSDECTTDSSEHDLLEQVFPVAVKCHKCSKYIASGSTGFQCAACGLCLHSECIMDKIQPCNREKLEARKKSHQHAHNMGFGSDLCKDVPQSRDRIVPDIIYICTQEIQRQLHANPELNVIDAYKMQKSTEDVGALKRLFDSSGDLFTVPVMDIDISILCSVIKKYLCELTNPLIPTEWYTEFIDSARLGESEGISVLGCLVNQLPKYHNSTLQYLFSHFYKIIEGSQSKGGDIHLALAKAFCHIILRPDWSEISTFVGNTQHHLTVLRRLFSLFDNNNTECDKHTKSQGDAAGCGGDLCVVLLVVPVL